MFYSPIAPSFFVVDRQGRLVPEKSRRGDCVLVFFNRIDAVNYRQQMSEVRRVPEENYLISSLPMYQINILANHSKVRICAIDDWNALVA